LSIPRFQIVFGFLVNDHAATVVWLGKLEYPDPNKWVAIQLFVPTLASNFPLMPLNSAIYLAWSHEAKSLDGIGLVEEGVTLNLTGSGKPAMVTADEGAPAGFCAPQPAPPFSPCQERFRNSRRFETLDIGADLRSASPKGTILELFWAVSRHPTRIGISPLLSL
jgi:hypothetical protein